MSSAVLMGNWGGVSGYDERKNCYSSLLLQGLCRVLVLSFYVLTVKIS